MRWTGRASGWVFYRLSVRHVSLPVQRSWVLGLLTGLGLSFWLSLLGVCSLSFTTSTSNAAEPQPFAPPTVRECELRIRHDGTDWPAAATGAALSWGLPQSDLIVRIVERRENKEWDTTALSAAGAVGLTQIKPTTVCRYMPGCRSSNKSRLDLIAQQLRNRPRFALCWAGKILSRLLLTCGAAGLGCAVSAYYTGEVGAIYAADVLND